MGWATKYVTTTLRISQHSQPISLGEPLCVARVLDVVKSQLCWVIGTVYMDMPLKPNVLEDIGRDVSDLTR